MQQEPVRAKKRLGQHFLNNPSLARRVVAGLNLKLEDTVLEIGCGTGSLTRHLVDRGFYIGVELDTVLCSRLQQKYGGRGIEFLNRDILTLDLGRLRNRFASNGFRVVGNLPYAISSPILQHLARYVDVIDLAVVMLQAEVAGRLVAEPGGREYGVLTLIIQYYFRAEPLFTVPPQAFKPRPKVDSRVVRLIPQPHRLLRSDDERCFFQFVKRAFSQRRKTLRNCLKAITPERQDRLMEKLEELGYPKTVRAEEISLAHFLEIFFSLRGIGEPSNLG